MKHQIEPLQKYVYFYLTKYAPCYDTVWPQYSLDTWLGGMIQATKILLVGTFTIVLLATRGNQMKGNPNISQY